MTALCLRRSPPVPNFETGLELVDTDVELSGTWQQRTIERRLSTARARALARSSRFLATALELVEESGKADFTIQTLIDRSNLSLRAFYQHFAGKEELMLALYENVTSQFTENIRQEVAAADGPMDQLEAFCRGVLSRAESSETVGGRVMTIYNLSLEIERPDDFAKVWEPHLKLLTKIITSCSRAGLVRDGPDPRAADHVVEHDAHRARSDRGFSSGRQGFQADRGPIVGVVQTGASRRLPPTAKPGRREGSAARDVGSAGSRS